MQTNIDTQELNKFDQLAQDWWDPNGHFKTLHDINPLRLQFIRDEINIAGQQVLDVGCGGGILAESMAQVGGIVTGLDMAEQVLATAKQHSAQMDLVIDYRLCPVEELAEQNPHQFDVVTCMEMLEHVPDPISVVNACAQLLKPGGKVFFSTINRNIKAYLLAIVGAEYIMKLLPKGTHEYQKFIRPSELMGWCRQAGLNTPHMKGINYNPFTRHFSLSTNVDVNYLMCLTKAL